MQITRHIYEQFRKQEKTYRMKKRYSANGKPALELTI